MSSPSEPVIVMSGEGVVKAAPDLAWVTFAVESRSKNPKEAQTQNAKSMTSVQDRLLAAFGLTQLQLPTIALIVGLHFIPLAGLFRVGLYYVTGALLSEMACAILSSSSRGS